MIRDRSGWELPIVLLLMVVLIGSSIWLNLRLAENAPGGEEFLTQWYAIRSWITKGTSPYNTAIRLETEMLAYGHAAQAGDPRLLFTSPIYATIVIFPFAIISDFALARSFWMMLLELAILATVILSAQLANWRPRRLSWLLLVLFAWLGFYSVHSIWSGSPAALTGLFLVLGFTALRAKRLELAGVLLALATCFPSGAILISVFMFLWALASKKRLLAVWFLAGVLFLSAVGLFFIRDWPLQYLRSLLLFFDQQSLLSSGAILAAWLPGVGRQLSWGITILLSLALGVEWFFVRKKDIRWLLWTISLTLVLEPWIGIPTRLSSMVILLQALVLVLANWEQRLERLGSWLSAGSLLFLIGLWVVAWRNSGEGSGQLGITDMAYGGMLFLLPLFLIVGLYWVRWWAIRPPRMYLDELRSSGH